MADEKAAEQETVTVTDLHGNEVEVPVGLDGENPVSPNNPAPKAVAKEDREAALAAREAELKYAQELAEVSGAGENAASTNKEDNTPAETEPATGAEQKAAEAEAKDEKKQQTGTRGASGKQTTKK